MVQSRIHNRPKPSWRATASAASAEVRTHRHIGTCILIGVKPIEFVGNSLDDLREFPVGARRECGYQLDRVQHGFEPSDWKPMPTVGGGVREIRVREQGGTFRLIYVAKLADRIYVLHCFQKRTQKTAKADLDLAAKRYRHVVSTIQDRTGERT